MALFFHRSRIIQAKIVWQGVCDVHGKAYNKLDVFMADGAELVKSEVSGIADACAVELLGQFCGKSGG